MNNASFSRFLLAEVHKEVKKAFPEINLRKAAWVYGYGRDGWEFHGPDKFYWNGKAGDAYDARAKGWSAYLQSKEPTHV